MSRLRLGIALTILVLSVVFLLGAGAVRSDLNALKNASQETVFWSAAQLEREINAFRVSVAQHIAAPDSSPRKVQRRFDVLWSRVGLFQEGEIGARMMASENVAQSIEDLEITLRRADPVIAQLGATSLPQLRSLSLDMDRHAADVRRIAVEVLHMDRLALAMIRDQMRRSILLSAAVGLLVLAGSVALLVYFYRSAQANAALAREAEAASRARQRFFAHVSHELRTPLNGVLGALALLREEPDRAMQLSYVEQAGHSAERLSGLLTDAIDLSAEEPLGVSEIVFRLEELAEALRLTTRGDVRRLGAELEIESSGQPQGFLRGDLRRIDQIASHLLQSVLRSSEARRVHVRVSYAQRMLKVELRVPGMNNVPVPIGIDMLYALAGKLGGTLTFSGEVAVLEIPVAKCQLRATTEFGSSALHVLYCRLLEAEGVEMVAVGQTERRYPIDLVLCDRNAPAEQVERLRQTHPDARMIGCGAGAGLAFGFDAVAATATDIVAAVQRAFRVPGPRAQL